MKRIATLILAAGMIFGCATGSYAIDFKAKGQWLMNFDYGQNAKFVGGSGTRTGWGANDEDEFNASQRLRFQLDAVASEALSGTVMFEIGQQRWGKATDGGALGADGNNVVKVKRAYIDFVLPNTDLKTRMGIQNMALPSFTTGSQILNEDVAGVSVSYAFNENVAATLFWARPYNDNYVGYGDVNGPHDEHRKAFMDNFDLFGLSVPLTFDTVKVTPFAMLGFIGPNTFRGIDGRRDYQGNIGRMGVASASAASGLFPLGGARDKNGNVHNKRMNKYATAWWAGVTADATFDPVRVAAEFNYGSVKWDNNQRLNRSGWLVSALAEYKMDWGVPGIVGWYASGDDKNPKNGSERMPVVGNNSTDNDFSNFAFAGDSLIARDGLVGQDMTGTWGVGLRVRDMSFVEDLKHTFRLNYIGGTNEQKNLKRIYGANAVNDAVYQNDAWNNLGLNGLYMTKGDSILELSLSNEYKVYDNLNVMLQGSYLVTGLTGSNRMGVREGNTVKRKDVRDPWNINMSFVYSF